MSTIEARSVTRQFGAFTAVDDVDLTVDPGEVVGLIGANGAGKTTLIRMVLGLLQPTSGSIEILGSPPSRQSRHRIGYVPQNMGLYRDLTTVENLQFRAAAFGGAPAAAPFEDRGLIGSLPLGLQRRAAFVAATQHDPAVLILDEPTSGVSSLARSKLWNLIRERAEAGAAVLVSTHYMDEAEQADRLVLMSRGRVAGSGAMAEIIGDLRAVEVTARRWQDAFELLDGSGPPVTLAGRAVRVLGEDADVVRTKLEAAGVVADVRAVAATLDEKMVLLDS
jgi:ABC-2 type transport system ATP-binding protein/ribosome-dependent ATPase